MRIVELLVGLNALGGICTFLGLRFAGRRAKRRTMQLLRMDKDVTQ